jgi:hypothetical protein
MIASDISGAASLPFVVLPHEASEFDVQPGTLHLSVPYTSRWTATLDGKKIAVRPAFGLTNAYDISAAGRVNVSFQTSRLHSLLVFVQVAAWVAVLFLATSRRRLKRKATTPLPVTNAQEPLLTFAAEDKA